MVVSYNWLKEYFDKDLPKPKELAGILNTRAFEIEGVEEKNEDYLIDVDVLPNRAHDCLSHYGIAKEISVLTKVPINEIEFPKIKSDYETDFSVEILDDKNCLRFVACEIKNIKVAESSDEIKNKLEILGQRSINNIVDITNLLLLELGQPLHIFDRSKIEGNKLIVRPATEGETMVTLDDNEIEFSDEDLVVADSDKALSIAGIKGGKNSGVTNNTTDILIEVANWNSSFIRRASRRLGIKTDSSKRYEHEITSELAFKAIQRAIELVRKYAGTDKTEVSQIIDIYPRKPRPYHTGVSLDEVNRRLGLELNDSDIEDIFKRLKFEYKKVKTKEIVVEEIQKHVGKPHNLFPSITYDAPESFDCSSLVAYSFALGGLSIPRITIDQYVWGNSVDEKDLEPGDLIFANSQNGKVHYETINFIPGTKVEEGIDHVGMYLGDDKVIHSGRENGETKIETLSESKHFKDPVGYRRMVDSEEERFAVRVPDERLDIRIKEDLIEEIGRVYGYEYLPEPEISGIDRKPSINKEYAYNKLIRKTLVELGFSEIVTTSFLGDGEVRVLKSFAEDRPYLRSSLRPAINKAIDLNLYNADLLGIDSVKVFEIGKVFSFNGETLNLAIAVVNKKGYQDTTKILNKLKDELGTDVSKFLEDDEGMSIINLDALYENLDTPDSYVDLPEIQGDLYKTFSQYPFVLRDLAVWVPGKEGQEDKVLDIVRKEAGELLVSTKLFDVFTKDDKTSYAFRLVFQSFEKTLSDEEINPIMEKITNILNEQNGFEVR